MNKDEAEEQAETLKADILNRIQSYVFSEAGQTLLQTVKKLLDENDLTITAAETLTGGEFLVGFKFGTKRAICGSCFYSTEVKNKVLGFQKEVTDKYGVVDPHVQLRWLKKPKKIVTADIAVSATGSADHRHSKGEIPPNLWIGLAKKGKESFAKEFHFAYKRNKNRRLSVFSAMNLVRQIILEEEIEDKVFIDDRPQDKPSAKELE